MYQVPKSGIIPKQSYIVKAKHFLSNISNVFLETVDKILPMCPVVNGFFYEWTDWSTAVMAEKWPGFHNAFTSTGIMEMGYRGTHCCFHNPGHQAWGPRDGYPMERDEQSSVGSGISGKKFVSTKVC